MVVVKNLVFGGLAFVSALRVERHILRVSALHALQARLDFGRYSVLQNDIVKDDSQLPAAAHIAGASCLQHCAF